MKKIYLSLGAMLLAGVVLASCGANSGVKKPSKGKAVDKVTFTDSSIGATEFTKDTKAEDLVKSLTGDLNPTSADAKNSEYKITSVYSYNSTTTKENNIFSNEFYKKYKESQTASGSMDYYTRTESSDSELKREVYLDRTYSATESDSADDMSYTTEEKVTEKDAGSYIRSSGQRTIDFGIYTEEKDSYKMKSSTMSGESSSSSKVYKYLDASEKLTDENYGATYYGTGDSGETYYYSINSFFKNNGGYSSICVSVLYHEEYKDLFDISFELTDKYIIIKADVTYLEEVSDYLNDKSYLEDKSYDSTEAYLSAYKDILAKEYKGSKTTYEIWIDYNTKNPDQEDKVMLSYAYYKVEKVIKASYSIELNDKYFDKYSYADELKEKAKGKTQKVKINSTSKEEYAVNTNDYSKKIKSVKDSCKKNNIFDKIDMKVGGLS
jgi:hypothetical protein